MGDTEVVLTSMGYLVIVAVLLAMAGFAPATAIELPSNPYAAAPAGQNQTTGTASTFWCVTGSIAGIAIGGTVGAVLGFGVGGIAGAAFGGFVAGSLIGGCQIVEDTVSFLIGLVDLVLNFFGFLFQLLFFQIPEIPPWLNAIIILPPGIACGFVALRTIRGTGG